MQIKDKVPCTSEMTILQSIMKLIQKEQSSMSAHDKYLADKRAIQLQKMNTLEADDRDWLSQPESLHPILYQSTKNL